MDTSAQYSDINPIRNLLINLGRKIRNHIISSKDDLKRALQDEWGKIEQSFFEKLLNNIPNTPRRKTKHDFP